MKQNKKIAIRVTVLLLLLIAIATIHGYNYLNQVEAQTITITPPPVPNCQDLACLVTLRTDEVFARDFNKYMEQARLTALHEINLEQQDMVYQSPYNENDNNN